ncbi:hypothetical protein CDO28_34445 (plasmid) [Sinorhizobium meliloti]|nr:hypothetical protein CDO28_34445 [Sinorhizobium meliloti]
MRKQKAVTTGQATRLDRETRFRSKTHTTQGHANCPASNRNRVRHETGIPVRLQIGPSGTTGIRTLSDTIGRAVCDMVNDAVLSRHAQSLKG